MVVIPSYEPDEKLLILLEELKDTFFMGVLVVDDGSGQEYSHIFDACKKISKVTCIGYDTNKGKGHALKTAFSYILENFPDCEGVVTADSDGQHIPKDICKIGEAVVEMPDHLILGARNCLEENVPTRSRIGNRFTRWIFKVFSGNNVQDTQTGLRGMSKYSMKCFLKTRGQRFEYEMYMLADCNLHYIKIRDIPIQTVYIHDNASSHFRTFSDAVRISAVFFKYLSSSIISTIIDYSIFLVLLFFLHEDFPQSQNILVILSNTNLLISFFAARFLSSTVNFIINKKLVFKNKGKVVNQLLKYYLSVFIVAILTYVMLSLLTAIYIPTFLAQPMATVIMMGLSYTLQRKFIFNPKHNRHELDD